MIQNNTFRDIYRCKNAHLALLNSTFCASSITKNENFAFKEKTLNKFIDNFQVYQMFG